MPHLQKASLEQILESYSRTGNIWKTGEELGMVGQSVWERLRRTGMVLRSPEFTDHQKNLISELYSNGFERGELAKLCLEQKLSKPNVARYARRVLRMTSRTRKVSADNCLAVGVRMKKWMATHEHPRGFLGGKHSSTARATMSQKSRLAWVLPESKRMARVIKMRRGFEAKKGVAVAKHKGHGNWKSEWITIGGKTFFARSTWELNYALYLEAAKNHGKIKEWDHEVKSFWFPVGKLKQSLTYTPDFKVQLLDGTVEYREVKGWMDPRSISQLDRMKQHFPEIKIRVIDKFWFRKNAPIMAQIIPKWRPSRY